MVMSGFGSSSCFVSRRNEGIAITTRISTGTIVQATSSSALWVVFDGTGLARSLKRNTQMPSSTITKRLITVMMGNSRLS